MPDRLQALLSHFAVSARTFNAGALCGINSHDGSGTDGQLHLVRSGEVEVRHGNRLAARVTEPSLLLYPRPMAHRFITDAERAILPAFGAYAGGLNVRDRAFAGLFARPPLAGALGVGRVHAVGWRSLTGD